MTKVKFCGMTRQEDIEAANRLCPEYIGFVFYPQSKRYVALQTAMALKKQLSPDIQAVGVFVDEEPEQIAALYHDQVIDIAQLHGNEDAAYIEKLRNMTGTDMPVIKAFRMIQETDLEVIRQCPADEILLDAGMGEGKTFDWSLIGSLKRPYFLAGGLNLENIGEVMKHLKPYAVDVSSGIETDAKKDTKKMELFLNIVRRNANDEVIS